MARVALQDAGIAAGYLRLRSFQKAQVDQLSAPLAVLGPDQPANHFSEIGTGVLAANSGSPWLPAWLPTAALPSARSRRVLNSNAAFFGEGDRDRTGYLLHTPPPRVPSACSPNALTRAYPVEATGIEPATSCMPCKRSTN